MRKELLLFGMSLLVVWNFGSGSNRVIALCICGIVGIIMSDFMDELKISNKRKALNKLRYLGIDCFLASEEVSRLSREITKLDLDIEKLLLTYCEESDTMEKVEEKRSERIGLANEKTTLIQLARHRELTEEESKLIKYDFGDVDLFFYSSSFANDTKILEGVNFYKRVCGI